MGKTVRITIPVSRELMKLLKAYAEKESTTLAEAVRLIVTDVLKGTKS